MNPSNESRSFGHELRLDQVERGILEGLPAHMTHFIIGGVAFTRDELLEKVRASNAPYKAARLRRAASREFAAQKPRLEADTSELMGEIGAMLASTYGRTSQDLARFGFRPLKKRGALTVEENILRTAKARLTRQKRGTLGKRQREAIKAEALEQLHVHPDGTMTVVERAQPTPPQPTPPQPTPPQPTPP